MLDTVYSAKSSQFIYDGSERDSRIEAFLTFALTALLIFNVLAFGGTHDWTIAVFELGTGTLVLLWALALFLPGRDSLYLNWSPLYPFLFAFAALVAGQLILRSSVYPFATRVEALRYAAYGFVFFLAQQLLGSSSRLRRFLHGMAWFGFLLAIEAIAQDFTSNGAIYWHFPRPESGTVYGPYVDHSHYAGLMEMLWPVPAILSSQERGAKRGLYAFFGSVMAASIVFSRSRGGSLALVVQVVFLISQFAKNRGRGLVLRLSAAIVIAAAFVYWAHPEGLSRTVATLVFPTDATLTGHRLDIARDSLRMFREHPIAGWGLETFPVVYPRFRSFTTTLFINEAHNDYVQLLVEMGLLGGVIVAAFLISLYRAGFRRMGADDFQRSATLIALTGCTGIVCHSLTDFNLHIPANAALFYLYCSIATLPMNVSEDVAMVLPRRPGSVVWIDPA